MTGSTRIRWLYQIEWLGFSDWADWVSQIDRSDRIDRIDWIDKRGRGKDGARAAETEAALKRADDTSYDSSGSDQITDRTQTCQTGSSGTIE